MLLDLPNNSSLLFYFCYGITLHNIHSLSGITLSLSAFLDSCLHKKQFLLQLLLSDQPGLLPHWYVPGSIEWGWALHHLLFLCGGTKPSVLPMQSLSSFHKICTNFMCLKMSSLPWMYLKSVNTLQSCSGKQTGGTRKALFHPGTKLKKKPREHPEFSSQNPNKSSIFIFSPGSIVLFFVLF